MTTRRRPCNPKPSITRRDFLNGVALGTGTALLGAAAPGCGRREPIVPLGRVGEEWYGYGGVGDYRSSHGNTPDVVNTAHRVRDGDFETLPIPFASVAEFDLVIVGAGIAGLSAALEFLKRRQPGQTCLILDNHPLFGGEAKENEFDVDGARLIAPQGANGFFVPPPVEDVERASGDPRYYADLGIPRDLAYAEWRGSDTLRFCRDNYGYLVRGLQDHTSVGHYFADPDGTEGQWAVDMFRQELANTPLAEESKRALLAWYRAGAMRRYASADEARRALDTMSYRQYLEGELGLGPEAADYADLFLASSCGLGSDAVSAFAAYNLPMPGLTETPDPSLRRNSFPGGNSGFARYFLKRLIPGAIRGGDDFTDIITGRIDFGALDVPGQPIRMRLASTAVLVEHIDPPESAGSVRVAYYRDGEVHGVEARAVVMATGGWINRHIVRDLPESHRTAYEAFRHAPFLVANVALTNWRFLERLGITAAIWRKSETGFGYTCNLRQPMLAGDYRPPLDPDHAGVLSFYTPFHRPGLDITQQVTLGRAELLATPYAEYERRILAQMITLFGASGFDPVRDVAGIILNRWGHAYSVPYPGFYGGAGDDPAPRDVIRRPYGRIAFAHSELDGLQHWGTAADEGRRAVTQLLGAVAAA